MIQVCDAIMGTGKSSAAITYMNEHRDEKFIYVTPYLEEAERIKEGCKAMHFVEPSDKLKQYGFKKSEHTAALIKQGKNITTTHQAFKRYSQDMLDDIQKYVRISTLLAKTYWQMKISKEWSRMDVMILQLHGTSISTSLIIKLYHAN